MAIASQSLSNSPIREARLLQHKTIAEASEEAGVHWQLWYLVEAGCYENIPPAINAYFSRQGVGEISSYAYREYRERKQREFGDTNREALSTLPLADLHCSPIKLLWEKVGTNRTAFAKSLAIQPAYLYRLEKGQARELPDTFQKALVVAGIPVDVVEELNERQIEFYEWNR